MPTPFFAPKPPAHELADDADPVGGHAELLGELAAGAPDVLRRDVDVEVLATPLAYALVRLERVVVQRLRRVLRLDDRVRLREPALDVAAGVVAAGLDERAAPDGLVRVEQRLEHLPLHVDQVDRGARLAHRLGRDRRDGVALEDGVPVDAVDLAGPDDGEHARRGGGLRQVDAADPSVCVRAAEERGLEQAGQADVAGVARLAAGLLVAVDPGCVAADDVAGAGRPLVERVLLDERPDLLVAALDLLLGADQPRHDRIASSMRG